MTGSYLLTPAPAQQALPTASPYYGTPALQPQTYGFPAYSPAQWGYTYPSPYQSLTYAYDPTQQPLPAQWVDLTPHQTTRDDIYDSSGDEFFDDDVDALDDIYTSPMDDNTYWRWQMTRPQWQIPHRVPRGWSAPGRRRRRSHSRSRSHSPQWYGDNHHSPHWTSSPATTQENVPAVPASILWQPVVPGTPVTPHKTPLQTPKASGIRVSSWLRESSLGVNKPKILWDLTDHPSALKRLTDGGNIEDLSWSDLRSPATEPRVTRMNISLPLMRLNWGLVTINKGGSGRSISVWDVVEAIWTFLQQPITPEDAQALKDKAPYGPSMFKQVEYSAWRRIQCAHSPFEYELRQGIKRVDVLQNRTVFWGMTPYIDQGGTVQLTVSLCPTKDYRRV